VATEHAVEPGKVSWFARGFFALVAIAAFACGFLGFLHYLPAHPEYGRGFLDLSYYSLQLFVLDASPLQTALTHTLRVRLSAPPSAQRSWKPQASCFAIGTWLRNWRAIQR